MDFPSQWLIKMLNAAVAEATVYPWKDHKDLRAKALKQVRDFLPAHQPATAAR
jgi:hypothetical protein